MFLSTLSNTKSDVIDQCLKKYEYKYIRKFPGFPSKNEDSLNFGSYIHKIFEDGHQLNDIKDLEKLAEKLKESYKVPFHYNDKVGTCLENFLRFNIKLGETIATEYEFTLELAEDIKYTGFIDRIVQGKDGGILIIDYKTSKSEKSRVQLFNDNQLKGYAFAASQIFKKDLKDIYCAHYYPMSGNLVDIQFPQSSINKWKKEAIDRAWKIRKKKADEFNPSRNTFCDWCEYQPMCPAFCSQQEVAKKIEEQTELKKKLDESKKQ
jgi:hypothetical protein